MFSNKLSVQLQWCELTQHVKYLANTYIPPLLARTKGKPWMTRNLLRLMRKQKRVFKRTVKYPTTTNIKEEKEINVQVKREIEKVKK